MAYLWHALEGVLMGNKSFGCTTLQRVEGRGRLTGAGVTYGFDFLFPARTWEYAPENASPSRCHPSWTMHLAISPELRIVSGGLPVQNPCNFGALDENITREKVAMSEEGFASAEKQLNSSSTHSGPHRSRNMLR
jgi:hypothetical protein